MVCTGAWAQESGFTHYKPVHLATAAEGYFIIDAMDQGPNGTTAEYNHHFIYDNNGDFATATSINVNNFDNYVWHVTSNGDDTYKFQNVGTGKCISIATGNGDGQAMTLTQDGTGIHFDFANGYGSLGNGNNQWYDCANAGTGRTTWSGGVSGSRRMRVHEAIKSTPTYTIMCKKTSKYATYNTNATESGITYLATSTGTPGNTQKIVLESANNGYFKMRIGMDMNKYVYAINTNDEDANIGVSYLGSNETGTEDKYLWKLKLNTEGYYNIVPKAGTRGWNIRGSKNSVSVIGQWGTNDSEDNRWQFEETESYTATFPEAGIYYVTFTGQRTGSSARNNLYNDLTKSDGYSLMAASKPEPITNNFIWKIQSDGNGNIASLLNGQGNHMKLRSGSNPTIESLQYEAHALNGTAYYYLKTNASGITNGHDCLNVPNGNNAFKNANGDYTLTTWITTEESGNAGDNHWAVDAIEMTSLREYTVVVTGSNAGYAIYNGIQYAANGGFFLAASIDENELSAADVDGFAKSVSLSNYTITVTYKDVVGLQAKIDDVMTAILADKIGYPDRNNGVNTSAITELWQYQTTSFGSPVDADNFDSALEALNAVYVLTDINLPKDGKAYFLTNVAADDAKTKHILYESASEKKLKWAPITDVIYTDKQHKGLYICRKTDDRFVFVNAATGNFLIWRGSNAGENSNKGLREEYAEDCRLTVKQAVYSGTYQGKAANQKDFFGYVCIGGTRGANNSVCFLYSTGGTDNFNQDSSNDVHRYGDGHSAMFAIEEVTDYAVNKTTLKTPKVGDGKTYASIYLPYSVELPQNVKAYKVTETRDASFHLEEISAEGNLPKETGAILVGEDTNMKTLVPCAATPTAQEDNKLSGCKEATSVSSLTGTVYVLNGGQDSGIGFFPLSSSASLSAYKAYYREESTPVQGFSFNFDEAIVTAIQNISATGSQKSEVYDLQGRRMQHVQKGLNIVNGRKVIR